MRRSRDGAIVAPTGYVHGPCHFLVSLCTLERQPRCPVVDVLLCCPGCVASGLRRRANSSAARAQHLPYFFLSCHCPLFRIRSCFSYSPATIPLDIALNAGSTYSETT